MSKFKEWFNKNVCTDYDATMGMFNKVWLAKTWEYQQTKLDKKDQEIKEKDARGLQLEEDINYFHNLNMKLNQENKELKQFVKDCSVSHIESRYKYKAKTLLKE